MKKASAHLTPVTLELGGKSPCIIDSTADLKLAARRIVFDKYLNCGQTCVAPDYICCHPSVKDAFLNEVKKQIQLQFGAKPLSNPDYGKIINEKHFNRISGLIDKSKVVFGGQVDSATLQCQFSGGCINDTIIHLATSEMPFGGFGESGMGGYHGREGFRTFSHYKSIVDKKMWLDLPMRYQPYKKVNDMLIHLFLK